MKTIADFKRKMTLGAKVNSQLFWSDPKNNMELRQVNDLKDREVKIVQSNSFALSSVKTDGSISESWCEWPKKDQFVVIDENTAAITWEGGKLIYQFQ